MSCWVRCIAVSLPGGSGWVVWIRKDHAVWRRSVSGSHGGVVVAVSRGITRAVEDQYQLGMRGLAAQVADLRAAVEVLELRCVLRPGELAPVEDDETSRRSRRRPRGYRSAAERFVKTRRLAVLRPAGHHPGGVGGGSAVDHRRRETVVAHP